MTKNLFFLAPLLATAVIVIGCGGDGANDTAPSQPAAAQTAEPETGKHRVTMAGSTFAPRDLKVKVGDVISFDNDDEIAHTVTAADGSIDTGTLKPLVQFDFTAEKAGTISYVCDFHPGMTGTIEVT